MTENEITTIVCDTIETAATYQCTGACETPHYAPGTPPGGYEQQAREFLAAKGYTLTTENMEGPSGSTTGPQHSQNPSTVTISTLLNPGRAFGVTAHEIAHVVLGHPEGTEEELEWIGRRRLVNLIFTGYSEVFELEMAAELAAVTVSQAAGMPLADVSLCYLSQRMNYLNPKDGVYTMVVSDATEAAKVMIPVLTGELVAA